MSATTWILCSKIVLISMGALSIAMAIKLSVPPVMAFAFCNVPAIWSALVSWLKPPYIYFIVNGIIITIVASSRFSRKLVDENSSEYSTTNTPEYSTSTHPPINSGKTIPPAAHVVAATIPVHSTPEINVVESPPPNLAYDNEGAEDEREPNIVELKPVVVNGVMEAMGSEAYDNVLEEEDDLVVSNSTWSHPETDESNHLTVSDFPQTVTSLHEAQLDYFPLPAQKKPLLPPRFGQTKPIKVIPAGGRAVRMGKPETLESTWKKIMESRERQLMKKSETFGCTFNVNAAVGDDDDDLPPRRVLKSATFRERTSCDDDIAEDDDDDGARSSLGVGPFGWSSNVGNIKRELSPSQDELNRRVEAFINKVNEDMRLQRQRSIDQYMEMINRGVN